MQPHRPCPGVAVPEVRKIGSHLAITLRNLAWIAKRRSAITVQHEIAVSSQLRDSKIQCVLDFPGAYDRVLMVLFYITGSLDDVPAPEPDMSWHQFAAIGLAIPLVEEIIFRAWLLEAWRRLMSPWLALVITSVIFSLIHPIGLTANIIFVLPGLLWGWLWLRYRSLIVCTAAHSSYNLLALTIQSFAEE